jgi:hypothetical protein
MANPKKSGTYFVAVCQTSSCVFSIPATGHHTRQSHRFGYHLRILVLHGSHECSKCRANLAELCVPRKLTAVAFRQTEETSVLLVQVLEIVVARRQLRTQAPNRIAIGRLKLCPNVG